jgi:hypothetical protein
MESSRLATLQRIDRGASSAQQLAAAVVESTADAVLLVWDRDPAGLFTVLGAAHREQKVVLPARWFPARSSARRGFADEGRLLWVARTDASLSRLMAESESDPAWVEGTARPDEPLALLGVEGDVLTTPATLAPQELRRRAEVWVQQLGVDRVALLVPATAGREHPLCDLGRQRGIPVLKVAQPSNASRAAPRATPPLLWTSFQLDGEHRLPDDAYVPGLRDLLHRGSLLRERTLYERLPQGWRDQADLELRALYGWQVSPLLRRVASLLQTLQPVDGVTPREPRPGLGGVCAYLLGLTDRRPQNDDDPLTQARALAKSLQEWDRHVVADVEPAAWPRLRSRLLSWAEGGHLAACRESTTTNGRRFCFSGQPLWTRAPLQRDEDGIPLAPLLATDRTALGWFELELVARDDRCDVPPYAKTTLTFPLRWAGEDEQLPLQLEGTGA